ncbi:MAG: polysaccharide export protein [Smithella sp.]|jgi:polysaccharide export outer membrane protein
MLRKILILMILIGLLGASSPNLSWSKSGDTAPSVSASSAKQVAVEPALPSSPEMALDEGDYLIGPGDVLDISVWKDEALTRSCVVRPDGAISFPLIGDIQATGKTPSQLKAEMEGKLDRYVPGGALSLEVKQINSLIIYVIGKVNAPGRFIMNANVNVLQAIAAAAGLNPFAKRNKIKVYRQGKNETIIFPFQYDEVIEGNRLEQNIRLLRGDVVVVP